MYRRTLRSSARTETSKQRDVSYAFSQHNMRVAWVSEWIKFWNLGMHSFDVQILCFSFSQIPYVSQTQNSWGLICWVSICWALILGNWKSGLPPNFASIILVKISAKLVSNVCRSSGFVFEKIILFTYTYISTVRLWVYASMRVGLIFRNRAHILWKGVHLKSLLSTFQMRVHIEIWIY